MLTVSATQGATTADRTAGQVWAAIMEHMGMTEAADYSGPDVTALDSDNSEIIGLWTGLDEMRASDALSLVAGSVGAWWGADRTGRYRIQRLEDPSGGSAELTFTANDVVGLERIPTADEGRGLPPYRTILRYQRNYTVMDLAFLADDSVTNAKIGASAVDTTELNDGAVTGGKTDIAEVSDITSDAGTLVAGLLNNAASNPTRGIRLDSGSAKPGTWTSYIDLAASSSNPIFYHTKMSLNADGTSSFSGTLSGADGTFAGNLSASTVVVSNNIRIDSGGVAGMNINQHELIPPASLTIRPVLGTGADCLISGFSTFKVTASQMGFFNGSVVGKPTGVAVNATAIHDALVSLNLIGT